MPEIFCQNAPSPDVDQNAAKAPQESTVDSDIRERKRRQNRIAQRTYRKHIPLFGPRHALATSAYFAGRNQALRLKALEDAVANLPGKAASNPPDLTTSATAAPASTESTPSPLGAAENAVSIFRGPPYNSGCEGQVWTPNPVVHDCSIQLPHRPPLHRAAFRGDEAMTRLLLEQGADVIKQDSSGQTALHIAVERGFQGVTAILLEALIDPNVMDSLGRTPLFLAVQSENKVLAEMLLRASVDANLKDIFGDAALYFAVDSGSETLALLLLQYGAEVNV